MQSPIRTVVLPVAGQGTRLLPATKATPKELLPVYDQPVLQFGIDEALAAGVERIVIVTHPSKAAIERYLAPVPHYAASLRRKGKAELALRLEGISVPPEVELVYAVQEEPLGLGHAVLAAEPQVLDGPVGVILPDDVILGRPCMGEMRDAYAGGHMVAVMEVSRNEVSRYGILVPDGPADGRRIRASHLVEKPAPEAAPSRLAVVGRYILEPTIFDALRQVPPGAGGEYQLTDAIAADLGAGGLGGLRFSGRRFDCGCRDGLLEAAVARRQALRADGSVARPEAFAEKSPLAARRALSVIAGSGGRG